jgi:hypothetical protein
MKMNTSYKIAGIALIAMAFWMGFNKIGLSEPSERVRVYDMPMPSPKIYGMVAVDDEGQDMASVGDAVPAIVKWCRWKSEVAYNMVNLREKGRSLERILYILKRDYDRETKKIPYFIYIDYQRYARTIYRHRDKITLDNARDWAYNECLMTGF